jgi:hypothetical protein
MPKVYSEAESVKALSGGLIANYHPELATARLRYIFVDKASKKGGLDVLGKARKVSGPLEYLLELDFLVEIAADKWQDLSQEQRQALVDHLLERCTGEEDEKSGEMAWQLREPDVQEFASILRRHGAWNDSLSGFVSVAQEIRVDTIAREEAGVNTGETQSVEENVEDLLSEID